MNPTQNHRPRPQTTLLGVRFVRAEGDRTAFLTLDDLDWTSWERLLGLLRGIAHEQGGLSSRRYPRRAAMLYGFSGMTNAKAAELIGMALAQARS